MFYISHVFLKSEFLWHQKNLYYSYFEKVINRVQYIEKDKKKKKTEN